MGGIKRGRGSGPDETSGKGEDKGEDANLIVTAHDRALSDLEKLSENSLPGFGTEEGGKKEDPQRSAGKLKGPSQVSVRIKNRPSHHFGRPYMKRTAHRGKTGCPGRREQNPPAEGIKDYALRSDLKGWRGGPERVPLRR